MLPNLVDYCDPNNTQTSFIESGALLILNWEKFNNRTLWNTLSTPNHAQQWFHNNQANLHSKNKWMLLSSSTTQRLHVEHAAMISRLSRLALVANLFSNTLQVVTKVVGTTLLFQNFLNTVPFSPAPSSLKRRYVDLTVYPNSSPSFQTHLSSLSKSKFTTWTSWKIRYANCFSHSNRFLLQK